MDDYGTFLLAGFVIGEDEKVLAQTLSTHGRAIGIRIDEQTALRLVQNRETALRNTGRLEFGAGILPDLVTAFADSPFLGRLEDDLCALNEAFYQIKNETRERLSDEELLAWMEGSFNGWCKGSIELLLGRGLEQLLEGLDSGKGAEVTDPRRGNEVTTYGTDKSEWWSGSDESLD